MRTIVPTTILIMLVAGCAQILPGQDKVLVNIQRSTAISFDSVNAFIQFDNDNREILKAKVPAVHALAERIRADAPAKFAKARELTRLYQTSLNAVDGQNAAGAVAVVEELARQARLALLAAQTKVKD